MRARCTRSTCSSRGFRVAEARNGNEAVAQAFSLQPGPDPDGPLAARHGWLGGDDACSRPTSGPSTFPIVALTGHALAGASEGARKAGCDSFVTKPCLPDDLVVEVRRMLDAVKKA